MLGIAFLGVGYGVYMRSCGFDMIWPICMAATIFAGSMEFVTVSLLLSTFNPRLCPVADTDSERKTSVLWNIHVGKV